MKNLCYIKTSILAFSGSKTVAKTPPWLKKQHIMTRLVMNRSSKLEPDIRRTGLEPCKVFGIRPTVIL